MVIAESRASVARRNVSLLLVAPRNYIPQGQLLVDLRHDVLVDALLVEELLQTPVLVLLGFKNGCTVGRSGREGLHALGSGRLSSLAAALKQLLQLGLLQGLILAVRLGAHGGGQRYHVDLVTRRVRTSEVLLLLPVERLQASGREIGRG